MSAGAVAWFRGEHRSRVANGFEKGNNVTSQILNVQYTSASPSTGVSAADLQAAYDRHQHRMAR